MRPLVHISVTAGLLILHALSASAEEFLYKQTGKYLGWKIPENKFRVCEGPVMPIENGRIEKTSDKCRKTPPPGPSVHWSGTLAFANFDTGIVRIVGDDGNSIDLYLASDSESWPILKRLTKGATVRAFGPVPGRADTVVIESVPTVK